MDDRPSGEQSSPALLSSLRGVVVVVLLVAGVAVFVRSPTTAPPPSDQPGTDPSSEQASDPTTEPLSRSTAGRAVVHPGAWETVAAPVPAGTSDPDVAVWTGQELVVGFTPAVAAYRPDGDGPSEADWRMLPPHPAGAVQVGGAVWTRASEIMVYGHRRCDSCAWVPSLYALDVVTASWRRLPDAPWEGDAREQVILAAGDLVVVRDGPSNGALVWAFDDDSNVWRDLVFPALAGRLDWQAIGVGAGVLIIGELSLSEGVVAAGAILYDGANGVWEDVDGRVPLAEPQRATGVWTGDQVVFFGALVPDRTDPDPIGDRGLGPKRDQRVGGTTLDLAEGRWRELPELSTGSAFLPDLSGRRSLDGLVGEWDGDQAVFVGGLDTPVFVGWSPEDRHWEVRQAPGPRLGGRAWWTGAHVLLWGGLDRGGPVPDLQVWSAEDQQR